MIFSFIKSNSNIFIFIFLIFFTIDGFILAIKFLKHLESIANFKISYDILKSYCLGIGYNNKYKLAVLNLTLENKSANPIDITNIKLIDASKSCLATFPKIRDDYNENGITLVSKDESKAININITSENILKNTTIPSKAVLIGYAIFENVELITKAKNYKLIIETPRKVFKKEIIINPLTNEFQPINLWNE